jgi:hypothetical protein
MHVDTDRSRPSIFRQSGPAPSGHVTREAGDLPDAVRPQHRARESGARAMSAVHDDVRPTRHGCRNSEKQPPEWHVERARHVAAAKFSARSHVEDHRRVRRSDATSDIKGAHVGAIVRGHGRASPLHERR